MKHAYLVRIVGGLFADTIVSLKSSPHAAMADGLRYYRWAASKPVQHPFIKLEHIMVVNGAKRASKRQGKAARTAFKPNRALRSPTRIAGGKMTYYFRCPWHYWNGIGRCPLCRVFKRKL